VQAHSPPVRKQAEETAASGKPTPVGRGRRFVPRTGAPAWPRGRRRDASQVQRRARSEEVPTAAAVLQRRLQCPAQPGAECLGSRRGGPGGSGHSDERMATEKNQHQEGDSISILQGKNPHTGDEIGPGASLRPQRVNCTFFNRHSQQACLCPVLLKGEAHFPRVFQSGVAENCTTWLRQCTCVCQVSFRCLVRTFHNEAVSRQQGKRLTEQGHAK